MGSSSRSSNATTSRTNSNVNNFDLADNQGFAAAGVGGDVNYTSLDGGAIAGSLDLANNALEFGGSTIDVAIDSVNQSQENAFSFSGGVISAFLDDSNNRAGDALEVTNRAFDFADSGLGFTDSVLNQSLGFAGGAFEGALGFAGGAFEGALEAINANDLRSQELTELAFEQTEQARLDALNFGGGAIDAIQESNKNSLGFINNAFGSALNGVTGAANEALNFVTNFASDTANGLAQSNLASIKTVSDATRSESSQSLDKLITVAGLAIGAVMVFSFIRK